MLIFVIGGIKSGKTKFALRQAEESSNGRLYYVATASPIDEEMINRIEEHRRERGDRWITIEEPIDLVRAFREIPQGASVVIDCLTTWITNLLVEGYDVSKFIDNFLSVLSEIKDKFKIVIISNEVGLGIIPVEPLSRKFIDIVGNLHQRIVQIADEFYFIICGCGIKIK